jgi:hypothetical protein
MTLFEQVTKQLIEQSNGKLDEAFATVGQQRTLDFLLKLIDESKPSELLLMISDALHQMDIDKSGDVTARKEGP